MSASSRGDVGKENNAGMSQLSRQQQPLARRRWRCQGNAGLAHPGETSALEPRSTPQERATRANAVERLCLETCLVTRWARD
jgi:hypothetical protein